MNVVQRPLVASLPHLDAKADFMSAWSVCDQMEASGNVEINNVIQSYVDFSIIVRG